MECRLCGEPSDHRQFCPDCLKWDVDQNGGQLEQTEMQYSAAQVLAGLKDLGLKQEDIETDESRR